MKSKLKIIQDLLGEQKESVFSEGPTPVTTAEKLTFRESLKTFSRMGESVYSSGKLKEVVESLTNIVETAGKLVTDGRQMKHVESSLKEFNKAANEVMINNRRMEAAFEDIAEGIQKYYEVH